MSVQGSKVNIGSSPRALEPALQRPLNFLKLSRSEDGSEYELCTASITMEREVGNSKVESVELVATVHLGEEDYFRGIQSCAASCDRVLFELVAGTPSCMLAAVVSVMAAMLTCMGCDTGPEDLWTDASGRQRLHQTPTPSDSQLVNSATTTALSTLILRFCYASGMCCPVLTCCKSLPEFR